MMDRNVCAEIRHTAAHSLDAETVGHGFFFFFYVYNTYRIATICGIATKETYLTYLDIFSERARLAPPWPLTSSQLNTASVHYLLDLSSCSLLSTLFLYFGFLTFSVSSVVSSFFYHLLQIWFVRARFRF